MDSPISVSYTHLDVYKRQEVCGFKRVHRGESRQKALYEIGVATRTGAVHLRQGRQHRPHLRGGQKAFRFVALQPCFCALISKFQRASMQTAPAGAAFFNRQMCIRDRYPYDRRQNKKQEYKQEQPIPQDLNLQGKGRKRIKAKFLRGDNAGRNIVVFPSDL